MSTTFEPRTATVKVWTGDYLDRIQQLEREFEKARQNESSSAQTLDETSRAAEIAQEHDALVAEGEQAAIHVRVQQLRRPAWKALVKEHPPRKAGANGATEDDERSDAVVGVNEETFKDALVGASIVAPEDLDLDALSDADFDRIYYQAFALNRGMSADPKASLVSLLTQKSDETSN